MFTIACLGLIFAIADALKWHAYVRSTKVLRLSASSSVSWISELSPQIKVANIQLGPIGDTGIRGATCIADIDGKTPIIEVPASVAIEVTNNRPPSPFPDFVPQPVWEKSLWFHRLAFKLLHEEKSLWFHRLAFK
eukprot:gene39980-48701_t